MRLRRVRPVTRARVAAALACVATFVACTLNPQPLPPSDFNGESAGDSDGGSRADASGFGSSPEVPGPAEDAATGTPNLDADGGDEGGNRTDGGDGGDGGDGSTDASDDGS